MLGCMKRLSYKNIISIFLITVSVNAQYLHVIGKEVFDNKGDKIIGVFGAMFPIEEGEIVSIDYNTKLKGAYAVDIMFREDGAVKKIMSDEICTLELLPERGVSPIGYYTEEAYYA